MRQFLSVDTWNGDDERRTATFSPRLVEGASECRDIAELARAKTLLRAKAKPALSRFCEAFSCARWSLNFRVVGATRKWITQVGFYGTNAQRLMSNHESAYLRSS